MIKQFTARLGKHQLQLALHTLHVERRDLYDTESDPHEIHNLAESDNPEHREALYRLRAALDTWIAETGDQGEWLEPEEIIIPFEKEMDEWFGTPEWYKKEAE